MELILAVVFTLGFLVITWWYLKMLKWNRYLGKYPGPYPLPIIGNAHYFKSTFESHTMNSTVISSKRNYEYIRVVRANMNGHDVVIEQRFNTSQQIVIHSTAQSPNINGHDTTTSGISFTLYCLSQYPDTQEKVVEELRHIFADDKTRAPNYKDLQDMKYLDLVIKESLRLYPPVPIYARILEEDVEFDDGILPEGLSLTLCSFALHRNPKLFSDPEKFDPERFSQENSSRRSPFAYLPFSAGARNCIGQRFAILEMKSAVSKVLRNFEILPVLGHKPILLVETILKSANGLSVCLKERHF